MKLKELRVETDYLETLIDKVEKNNIKLEEKFGNSMVDITATSLKNNCSTPGCQAGHFVFADNSLYEHHDYVFLPTTDLSFKFNLSGQCSGYDFYKTAFAFFRKTFGANFDPEATCEESLSSREFFEIWGLDQEMEEKILENYPHLDYNSLRPIYLFTSSGYIFFGAKDHIFPASVLVDNWRRFLNNYYNAEKA